MLKSKRVISILLCIMMILGMLLVSAMAAEEETLERYTVLVLDTSNSAGFVGAGGQTIYTANTAIEYVKKAATKFIDSLDKADGTNYVALVSFKATASAVSGFTTDADTLKSKVDGLSASDNVRDISAGLEEANLLLTDIPSGENVRKNVVLFTTGMTNNGDYSYEGIYNGETVGSNWRRIDTQVRLYAYANHAISVAEELKKQATLYSIGLFQTMEDMPAEGKDVVEFFKLTASDLATSEEYFYPVADPDDLEFTFGDVADDIVSNNIIESKFKWSGSLKKDEVGVCYYSDDYFLESSTVSNPHLRTMSLAFELSSCASEETGTVWTTNTSSTNAKWKNAKDLLCGKEGDEDYPGLGFPASSFDVNEFWSAAPTKDSIGVVAANKTLRDGSTLVALAIRGCGYEQEWASNFTMGSRNDHDGFTRAKENTLSFLNTYLAEQQITGPIKLWVVGYSRAGVTANMVGGELDSNMVDGVYTLDNGATVAYDDLFVYAFEPPQGAMKSKTSSGNYSNIHNIVNVNDIVPLVAPSAWNFSRYNSDEWIPNQASVSYFRTKYLNPMLKILDKFDGMDSAYSYYKIAETVPQYRIQINWSKFLPGGDPFIEKIDYDVATSYALQTTIDFVANGLFESRTVYVADWQAGIREIMALLNGGSLTDLASEGITAEEFLDKFFAELTFDRICEIVSPAFSLNPFYSLENRKKDIQKNIDAFVADVLSDSDLWGTVRWVVGLKDSLSDLLYRMLESAVDDLLNHDATAIQSIGNLIGLGIAGGLIQPHYSEITLAWMMSLDSYYPGGADKTNFSQLTRIVHINCPVDIHVYDNSGSLVAAIIGDEAQTVDGSSIPAFVNVNGEKIVMLPPDEDYEVRASATADGSVNLAIQEYYFSTSSVNRLLDYYNIPVQTGDQITAIVPKLTEQERTTVSENGSLAQYQVRYNQTTVAPSDSLTGYDAQSTHSVAVTVEGDGVVSGSGTYGHGTFAQLQAFPQNGVNFLGWYEDGALVSTAETYRFPVTRDAAFTAKFGTAETYRLTFSASSGGTVQNVDVVVPAGVKVNLAAEANPGYVFAAWEASSGQIDDASSPNTWFTMPEEDVEILAIFEEGANVPSTPPSQSAEKDCPSIRFADVNTDLWYHEAIDFVLENNYMAGTGAATFEPNGTLTRAMLVQILYNMEGKPDCAGSLSFTDVEANAWYEDALNWAVANKIVLGYSDSLFKPNDAITREQMATILFRYHAYCGKDDTARSNLAAFSDAQSVSDWAKDAVQWAVANKIINGVGNGILDPLGTATRAQVAQIIRNYLGS